MNGGLGFTLHTCRLLRSFITKLPIMIKHDMIIICTLFHSNALVRNVSKSHEET